jgi:hypothetical protein
VGALKSGQKRSEVGWKFAGIAQLVERLLAMQKVAGSSPVARLKCPKKCKHFLGAPVGSERAVAEVGAVAQSVRVPVMSPKKCKHFLGAPVGSERAVAEVGAVAQSVRVPVCHTGGRGFEPRQPRW